MMAGKAITGDLEMKKNDSRCLLVGEHVVIAAKANNEIYYANIEPAIPKTALITYSSMAAAHFANTKDPYVLPIENVEAEDVTEVLVWIIKTCETGKPAKIANVKFNPIANHNRKLDLAKKLGIKDLQTTHINSIKYALEMRNVHAHDAQKVYTSYPPLSPICWQVAKNMAKAIHKDRLLEHEKKQYRWVRYEVRNLDDNIKTHLAEMEKSAGGQ